MRKAVLRSIGAIGALAFGYFFSLTFYAPEWVETFARSFIEHEVTRQVDARIDGLVVEPGSGVLSQVAGAIYQHNEQRLNALKAELKTSAHENMAKALAQISDFECACRDKIVRWLGDSNLLAIAALNTANDALVEFIQGRYQRVTAELKRDLRVFTATNCAVFLLLLFATLVRPQAISHLFVPGILALIATAFCTYMYLFEQNWLLTIIYRDYLGFAYLAYLAVVFLLLCDVFINRARVTTKIFNGLAHVAGSFTPLSPC